MKTSRILLFFLVAISLLYNCAEDENGEIPGNSKFAYKGKEYPLTKGFIGISCSTPTIDHDFYSTEVYLASSDNMFTGLCPGFHSAGSKYIIALSLSSKSDVGLTEGVYAEPTQSNMNQVTLQSATLHEYVTSSAGSSYVAKGMIGTVTVSRSGPNYIIMLNLKLNPTSGSDPVTGTYEGTLAEY